MDGTPNLIDTPWTTFRWRIALWIMRLGIHLAPAGTAANRLGYYHRLWCNECVTAWERRYPGDKHALEKRRALDC